MFNLDTFVVQCQDALRESNAAAVVEALVKQAITDPEGLRAAFASTSTAKTIEEAAVFRSDTLTVLDVSNSPGLKTPAHNHCMWAVIGVYDGEEQNVFYKVTADGLDQTGERLLREGDVVVLDANTIHAIANPLDRKSYAIHVYGGDIVTRKGRSIWNPKTQAREPYDTAQLSAYVREMTKG